jgi:hypothetical protein
MTTKTYLMMVALSIQYLLVGSAARADLITGWDFQTTTNGGTATAASPSTPKLYTANFGVGTLYLNGEQGSSDWTVGGASTELNSFGGTTVNAGAGFSTTTSGAASLALANQSANGKAIVFKFSMAGFEDLIVSYATQRTGTGFNSQDWDFSTDGINWTDAQTVTTIQSSFAAPAGTATTLNTITGLNNATDAYLKVTFTGASSAAGNNRLDNIQFNAISSIPEPTSMLLVGMVATGGLAYRMRRRTTTTG